MSAPRRLSPLEQEVVLKELRQDARTTRLFAWFMALMAPLFGVFTLMAIEQGSWLVGALIALVAALTGAVGLLLLKRRAQPDGHFELTAVHLRARCHTRLEGGKHKHPVHYVGHYRVGLRAGWQAFWPEGEEALVELCFAPEQLGATWAAAAVVSLPGIDIAKWRKDPPPTNRAGLAVLLAGAGLLAAAWTMAFTDWANVASRLRNLGEGEQRFSTLAELARTPSAFRARVTIEKAHRVAVPALGVFLCAPSVAALATLRSELQGLESAPEPTAAQIGEQMARLCDLDAEVANVRRFLSRSRELDDAATRMIRETVEDQCRERALRAAQHENWERNQHQRHARLRFELTENSANVCARSHDPRGSLLDSDGPALDAVQNQVGVLVSDRVWWSGAPAPSLFTFTLFLLSAGTLLFGMSFAWKESKSHAAALGAWADRLRRKA